MQKMSILHPGDERCPRKYVDLTLGVHYQMPQKEQCIMFGGTVGNPRWVHNGWRFGVLVTITYLQDDGSTVVYTFVTF